MRNDTSNIPDEIASLRAEVAYLRDTLEKVQRAQSVRRRSNSSVFGIPLYEIAMGPNLETGEVRGHAKAIIAIGDIATGVVAIGGFAQGGLAIGGMSLGVFSLGGFAVGLVAALGGLAAGSLAVGGCAVGFIAIGGATIGQYVAGAEGVSPEITQTIQILKTLWKHR